MLSPDSRRALALALLAGAGLLPAATNAATLGDPAGPLSISDWIKGEPVDLAKGKGKQVYVVEFWATWCGPCKVSIPHLTQLAQKFKDQGVTFIGISDEDSETVKPFVTKMGDKMDYTVACDPSRRTQDAYMRAYNQNGIPTAFIVDQEGRIAWVGHPMANLEKTLEKVVAGKYDVAQAKKEADEEKALNDKRMLVVRTFNQYMQLAFSGEEQEKAAGLADQLLKEAAGDAMVLNQIAWIVLNNGQIKARDFAFALRSAKAAVDASGAKDPLILNTYAHALAGNGKLTEAIEQQRKAVGLSDSPPQREELAKTLKDYEAKAGAAAK